MAFEQAVLVFLCWRHHLLRSDLTHMPEMKVQHIEHLFMEHHKSLCCIYCITSPFLLGMFLSLSHLQLAATMRVTK